MLGWRSEKIKQRIAAGFANDLSKAFEGVSKRFKGRFALSVNADHVVEGIRRLEPARIEEKRSTGSFVIDAVARQLPTMAEYSPQIWDRVLDDDRLKDTLAREVVPKTMQWYQTAAPQARIARITDDDPIHAAMADQLSRESVAAGYLLYLKEHKQFDHLKELFYKPDVRFAHLAQLLKFKDPLDSLDPFKDIDRASLSPLGIVHLFRQYFFEFDTFLSPPVSHVWLSPGSTVELLEISTRRELIERTIENALETTVKTEKSITEEDELSEAVKEDNKSDTKFGMNATVNQGWIGGSASASASIDMGTTQSKARETTHKHMRQQTEKLSTEIRKNYKSTFKTVTEITDTSSKRYVLNNTTQELINYELRRKMRQVGVQVQDIGTHLCWQTYVDDPGKQLGIAKLVHIAKEPEVGTTPPPESIPVPGKTESTLAIDIPFVQTSEDRGDLDEGYKDGREEDEDFNEGDVETIQSDFSGYTMICEQAGYQFQSIDVDYGGNDVKLTVTNLVEDPIGKITFGLHLNHVNFRGNSPIRVTAKVEWVPTDATINDINAKNAQKVKDFNEKTKYEYEKAFVEAARDRINKASRIEPRKFEDLREEERIVVYRALIQDMLTKGISMPDDRTRHVVSELLNTIFDIDKMLYFVAPEWWRPRLHHSHQVLGGVRKPPVAGAPAGGAASPAPAKKLSVYTDIKTAAAKGLVTSVAAALKMEDTQIAAVDTVSWGGVGEGRVDNYYITEDSDPAKLGASLGWLLQLDGDNLRNAFLNAPWVKAVIPVRPGKERAAINWLQRLHVEGSDGLDDDYVAPADQLAEIPHAGPSVTIRDAINHLCDIVAKKHEDSMKVGRYPADEINDDNRVSATPIDKVYEHGFYPLQGGFRVADPADFEIFDQWVEVLPTDQVVPVAVKYDPKTGRQI